MTPSDAGINQATTLAASRDAIVADFVNEQVPSKLAACAARVLVEVPGIRAQILSGKAPVNRNEILRQAAAAGVACRRNSLAGLP